jgi:hypothetical protein
LLIFSHGQTMALFTGEDPAHRGMIVGGPQFRIDEGTTTLSFKSALLEVHDAAAYVRLEHAFAQARLIDADLHLRFEPTINGHYGRVLGTVSLDGRAHDIDTYGFRDVPIFLRRPGPATTRCSVAAALGAKGLHVSTVGENTMTWARYEPGGVAESCSNTQLEEIRSCEAQVPQRLVLQNHERRLVVTPLNHMQIHRPLANGNAEMIFLGLAQCELSDGEQGYGFYEFVRPA